MFRVLVLLCVLAAGAAPAGARTMVAAMDRLGVCEAQRTACIRDNRRRYCMRPTPANPLPQCLEDVETQCAKAFSVCAQGGTAQGGSGQDEPASAEPAVRVPLSACDALFAQVRQAAPISLYWSTSYYAHAQRFIGITGMDLGVQGSTLVGQGTRTIVRPEPSSTAQPLTERQTLTGPSGMPAREAVSVLIRADNKVVFQNIYGPYEPRCIGGRFAIIETGDSVETFNFNIPMH